ncbi:MAG: hypothetical protein OXE86_13775 [Alphaproteobacteria bacterium]|nr:hypothetical protein [Alphaproteobacteria bacterium]
MCWYRVIRWLVFGVLLTTVVTGSTNAQTTGFEPADQEEFNRRLNHMTLVGSVFKNLEVRIDFSTDGMILDGDKVVARGVYVRSDHDSGTLTFQTMPGVNPGDQVTRCLVLLQFFTETSGNFVLVPGLFSAEQCEISDKRVWGTWRIEE